MYAEVLVDGSGSQGEGQERTDWIDPILYSKYLKIGEMVLVAFLMKKIIFLTAASGSKSRTDGPSSEIPMRSSRVSPPRLGRNANHS